MNESSNMAHLEVVSVQTLDIPWVKVVEVFRGNPHLEKLHVLESELLPVVSPIDIRDTLSIMLGVTWYKEWQNWLWTMFAWSRISAGTVFIIKQCGLERSDQLPSITSVFIEVLSQ